jgi:hypothetical protein
MQAYKYLPDYFQVNDRLAVVLLGYSGVGKDQIANAIIAGLPHGFSVNAKFGKFAKILTANAFYCTPVELEDKTFRNLNLYMSVINSSSFRDWKTSLSPMDVLTALFQSNSPKIMQAGIDYCLTRAMQYPLVFFTDVRRMEEFKAVQDEFSNVLVLRLIRPYIEAGTNDNQIGGIDAIDAMCILLETGNVTKGIKDVVRAIELHLF